MKVQFIQIVKNSQLVINAIVGGLFYLPTSVLAAVWGVSFMETHYQLSQPSAATGITFLFLGWAIGSL